MSWEGSRDSTCGFGYDQRCLSYYVSVEERRESLHRFSENIRLVRKPSPQVSPRHVEDFGSIICVVVAVSCEHGSTEGGGGCDVDDNLKNLDYAWTVV